MRYLVITCLIAISSLAVAGDLQPLAGTKALTWPEAALMKIDSA